MSCQGRIVVDLEVIAEVFTISISILILDLTDNFGNLFDAVMHSSDDLMLTDGLFHLIYCNFKKFFRCHWNTIFDGFTDSLHSLCY